MPLSIIKENIMDAKLVKIIARLLEYSFEDTKLEFNNLTDNEKEIIQDQDTFNELIEFIILNRGSN